MLKEKQRGVRNLCLAPRFFYSLNYVLPPTPWRGLLSVFLWDLKPSFRRVWEVELRKQPQIFLLFLHKFLYCEIFVVTLQRWFMPSTYLLFWRTCFVRTEWASPHTHTHTHTHTENRAFASVWLVECIHCVGLFSERKRVDLFLYGVFWGSGYGTNGRHHSSRKGTKRILLLNRREHLHVGK